MILDIIDLGDVMERIKNDTTINLVTCTVKDIEGTEGKITIWGDDNINKCIRGTRVKITSAYVNEWQGEMSLTTGKFGKVEKFEENIG